MGKEERIKAISKRYYRQKSVQKAILEAAQNREVVPRYYEGFGKRPDTLMYETDIRGLADKGATSFHCSVERWSDPLKLAIGQKKEEVDKLRIGWDFLIDVDCKFIEYSKVTASLLREALYFHNVRNFGVKFSGGTGFHLAVSYEAFPKNIYDIDLSNYFPDAARSMLEYLKQMIKKELGNRILNLDSMREISEMTDKSQEELKEDDEFNPYSVITLDSALISPRHLVRMPFSINEKTSLASIVIPPKLIEKFNPKSAKPTDFIQYRKFINPIESEEGRELLIQALDWKKSLNIFKDIKEREIIEIKGKVSDEFFPPCMKKAIETPRKDGRKRCLFILLNFFRSINLSKEEIEKKLDEWNKKHPSPLSENYLKSQISWAEKQGKKFPPPNCNHPWYKEIGIWTPECEKMKNPLTYVARKLRINQQKK